MADVSVVFTALPRAVQPGGQLALAAHVSPRIQQPEGGLGPFTHWPAALAAAHAAGTLHTTVEILAPGAPAVRVDAEPDLTALRPEWWDFLHPLRVDAYTHRDLSTARIDSYPAWRVHDLVRRTYITAAQGPPAAQLRAQSTGDGPIWSPLSVLEPLHDAVADELAKPGPDRDRALDRLLADTPYEGNTTYPPPQPPPHLTGQAAADPDLLHFLDLYQALRFFRPSAAAGARADAQPPAPHDPDFHEVLGALGDHPVLLNALGLAIPLAPLAVSGIPDQADELAIRVHLALPELPGTIDDQPYTTCVRDRRAGTLAAKSTRGDRAQGHLLLSDTTTFETSGLDADAAALRMAHLVLAHRELTDEVARGNDTGDLPALRSSGLTVSRRRQAQAVGETLARTGTLRSALARTTDTPAHLTAEDVTRGFRVEVFDATTNRWYSLVRRKVTYRLTGAAPFHQTEDEGYVKASAVRREDDGTGAPTELRLQEALFGWDGWSLVVPRPGLFLGPDPTKGRGQDGHVIAAGGRAPTSLPLEILTEPADGTLPRLRYGSRYRFRARTVDLTGYSVPEGDDAFATALVPYLRFEPVLAPAVIQRTAFTPGESHDHLVIRTTAPLDTSERHLAPPRTTQREAECLGAFDTAIGNQGATALDAARRAFNTARKEEGSFAHPHYWDVTDPGHPLLRPTPGFRLVPPPDPAQTEDEVRTLLDNGFPLPPGWTALTDTRHAALPYLPDPLADAIWLRARGSGLDHELRLPLTGTWPELGTYRIELSDGRPGVQLSATDDRLVQLTLPPAAMARITLSCGLAADGTDRLGLLDWFADAPELRAEATADALAGRHRMVTPGQDLIAVHAVPAPLLAPAFTEPPRPVRAEGEARVRFHGTVRCHARSTGRIDVHASWTEWTDDPADPNGPRRAARQAQAYTLPVTGWSDLRLLSPAPGARPDDRPDPAADAAPADPPLTFAAQQLDDTRHRRITYEPVATTRYREYFAEADTAAATGPAQTVDVPSSARPPGVRVRHVLPAFRWTETAPDDAPHTLIRRRSGALRAYLERPWYASGDGELLAVVTAEPGSTVPPSDPRRRHLAQWGLDPVRPATDLPKEAPQSVHFLGDDVVRAAGLRLPEPTAPGPVAVAAHPVHYHEGRGLWYADLRPDTGGAHWPFVHLSLARYQPHALPGLELSPPTRLDAVQAVADRTAEYTRTDFRTLLVTVTGVAEAAPVPDAPRGVRAWLEQLPAGTPDEADLGWERVGDVIDLPLVTTSGTIHTWSKKLALPAGIPFVRPGGTFPSGWRVVVEEWERFPYDSTDPEPPAVAERVTYTDQVGL